MVFAREASGEFRSRVFLRNYGLAVVFLKKQTPRSNTLSIGLFSADSMNVANLNHYVEVLSNY